jgi:hypothetical protein
MFFPVGEDSETIRSTGSVGNRVIGLDQSCQARIEDHLSACSRQLDRHVESRFDVAASVGGHIVLQDDHDSPIRRANPSRWVCGPITMVHLSR